MKIISDTREQKPLWDDSIKQKLDAGDYTFVGGEGRVAVERKSPLDAVGTFTRGHERFKRELERAKDYDYFGVYIECTREDMVKKRFKNSFRTKMRGYVIVKIIETMSAKYGFTLVWCDGRDDMREQILRVFEVYSTG